MRFGAGMGDRLVLVTSGLGPRYGGIGVVAEGLLEATTAIGPTGIWRHHHTWPRAARVAALGARAAFECLTQPPGFVLYDHVDLAGLSTRLPILRNVPYAIFMHGTEVWRPLDERRRRSIAGASLLLINSRRSLERAKQANPWMPEAAVVWLGMRRNELSTAEERRELLVLSIGRMHPAERYKGHDALLDAWRSVSDEIPGARLVMIGEGSDRVRLMRRVETERLPRVELPGFITQAAKAQLLARANHLVFASSGEGFGLAAVEAALAGLPVVGLRGEVLEEIFPAGAGTVLIDEASGARIARASLSLLQDPRAAAELGIAGREWAKSNLLHEHFLRRLTAALLQVVGPQPTRATC